MHHGGFFCGLGENRAYLDPKVDIFDELSRGNFSCYSLDHILSELGYNTADPRVTVYWCKPRHEVQNGLVAIKTETAVGLMKKCAKEEKTLTVYVDHVNLLEKQRCDDVIRPVELPVIISPSKPSCNVRAETEKATNVDDVTTEEGEESEEEAVMSCGSGNSSDLDSDFADSDYDLADDDEQFEKNVDKTVQDDLVGKTTVNIERHPDMDAVEEDELELPGEKKCWKKFNKKTDMEILSSNLA